VNAIELRGLTLTLGGRAILSGIDLDIGFGEFIGVLGPNGAGKTTLMRALLGMVVPSAGSLAVLGAAATRGNPAIGYMPQTRTSPASRLSGRDFVACAWRGDRWGLPLLDLAARREVSRVLDLVGAAALATRPLAELSGGERQRLLLAQALLGSPKLLLLDEPLMSLDPHHQGAVVSLVRELASALGLTVLFSAHELNPLIGAMDRVLYLGGGRAALGTVDQVMTGPVLSLLYGSTIEVVRLGERIFVLSGDGEVEPQGHCAMGHAHPSTNRHVHA